MRALLLLLSARRARPRRTRINRRPGSRARRCSTAPRLAHATPSAASRGRRCAGLGARCLFAAPAARRCVPRAAPVTPLAPRAVVSAPLVLGSRPHLRDAIILHHAPICISIRQGGGAAAELPPRHLGGNVLLCRTNGNPSSATPSTDLPVPKTSLRPAVRAARRGGGGAEGTTCVHSTQAQARRQPQPTPTQCLRAVATQTMAPWRAGARALRAQPPPPAHDTTTPHCARCLRAGGGSGGASGWHAACSRARPSHEAVALTTKTMPACVRRLPGPARRVARRADTQRACRTHGKCQVVH